ncbi:MAG: hypothetical protein HC886_00875 [Leptolyngbyaceae cyanobacterium SM1_1_3]|nr:hypothetical protein [Leptolyngbyaceae cyanobacterium SM1_1_3]NJN00985.1 hypothetical protein [Leptolyngbyaceae cyanobacterium RM1_1_2]NJO11474.1 hypothetical protein [Leptolyngbyaceae cyanobacterium SL_1_1]
MKLKFFKHHSIARFGLISVLAPVLSIAVAATTIANPANQAPPAATAVETQPLWVRP